MKTMLDKLKPGHSLWQTIGRVGVDSGTLMIADPCYLDGDDDWNEELFTKHIVGMEGKFKQISEICPHQAVAFESGFGDGVYEVRALFKHYGKNLGLRIKEVRVILLEDDDDESED